MDTFENNDTCQEAVSENPAAQPGHTQQLSGEKPVYAPTAENGTYRNAGVGRKESPFANSPYVMQHQQPDYRQPVQYTQPYQAPNYGYQAQIRQDAPRMQPRQEGPGKQKRSGFKTVLSAVLVLALVAGSCFVTASVVDSRWQKQNQQMQDAFNQQLGDMQQKIAEIEAAANSNSPAASGDSVSGSPVAVQGLTPGQVYAQNVDAVVMVYSYSNASGGYFNPGTVTSTGSGFFISQDGYLLTNHHVIEGAVNVTISTRNGQTHTAAIIGSDATNDVALLKVDAQNLPYVKIGSSADLIVGDQVAAIGNPLGELTSTMTVGYVSGKERDVTTDGTTINMIQTDAAINSGNSGGPLFNMKGEVIGITTAKYSGNSSSGASIEGIGFAIPIDDVMTVVSDLMEFGYVKSAYMGIMVRDMDMTTAEIYGLPVGVYVDSVELDGPAAEAGMKAKDIIIGIGQFSVSNRSDLTKALRSFAPGDTTTVRVFRAGAELELTITLTERPKDADNPVQTQPETERELPNGGSYEDWYDYLFPFG